jgi:putative DNA primase/helicase
LGKLLLVPLCDWAGNLHTLQTIQPDGTKLFLKGGSPKGRFHWIRCGQETGPVVYVCEGFATGSTVHAATGGKPVCVAINCGNLGPVCEVLRHHLPKTRIVVCADDDRETPGNPGLTKAMEAARAIRARIAIPRFIGGTDWNDLHQELGIMEAKRQLMSTKVPLTVAKAEV